VAKAAKGVRVLVARATAVATAPVVWAQEEEVATVRAGSGSVVEVATARG
tara:strand:+ start:2600 stop:2749 length:150 start_codon:yes stop_codon:yes gene_type:complete